VDVDVKTNDLKSGSAYEFHVSASRRTPALRVFAVPTIDTDPTTVNGTAAPSTLVKVSITDKVLDGSGPHFAGGTYLSDVFGNWTSGALNLSGLNDGLITFTVNYAAGGNAKATTTAFKDSTPMNARVTPITGSPTSDLTIKFLVSFDKPLGTGQCLALNDMTVTATPTTTAYDTTLSATCAAALWTVSVKILQPTGPPSVPCPILNDPTYLAPACISLKVKQNTVFDQLGVGNRDSNVPQVAVDSSPTILVSGGSGKPIGLSGTADPFAGDVTLSICADRDCQTAPPIPLGTTPVVLGHWTYTGTSPSLATGSSYYATVSQGGQPAVLTGPFFG
jgi:hypothetical protein